MIHQDKECPYREIVDEIKKEINSWDMPDYGDFRYSNLSKILEKHGVK